MSNPFGSASSGSSLFGKPSNPSSTGNNTPASPFGGGGGGSNLFGNPSQSQNPGQNNTGQGLFGTANSAPAGVSSFSFGKPAEQSGQNSAPSNPFGGFATPQKPDAQRSQSTGLFGQQTSAAQSGSSTPPASKPGFSFNNASTTPAGPPPANNLFGGLGQTQKSTTSLFGSTPQTAPQSSDQTSQKPASSLFSNQSSAPTSSLFATAQSAPAQKSLFGNTASDQSSEAPKEASKFSFANPEVKARAASDGAAAFSFPSLGNNSSQTTTQAPTSTSNLFGSAVQNAGANKRSAAPEQDAPAKGPTTKAPSSNLFGSLDQKKDDQPQPQAQASNLFAGLAQNKAKETSTTEPEKQPEQASAPVFNPFKKTDQKKEQGGVSTSAAQTSEPASGPNITTASAGGLFSNLANKSTQDTTASKPAEPTPASSSVLGASTAGPAPTPQSRLKNKSMDDIITRWATDLSKYQKEFQAQAEKVAEWDRMLLENSNSVSKLYLKTHQADRDTAEVQRQLSVVEGHQDELTQWLDKYERDVDEMIARQIGPNENLQGPDQEREKTYKIAGRVSDRLDEMGKDLTSMIEEINAASATISKTSKPDDPLSQIVRVLNGHLAQLQLIDQGAAELRGKVDAAQKERQRLGSRTNGAFNDNETADHFYRSYMRRG